MRKFIYLDSFGREAFHETFNASSLKMFASIYPVIDYYAFPSAKEAVEHQLGGNLPSNVTYHSLSGENYRGINNNFVRLLISNIINIWYILRLPKDSIIFINYNSLWSIKIISFILRFFKRKQVIIMFHGELEYLTTDIKLNFLSMRSLKLMQQKKFIPPANLKFCVLGKSIYNNISMVVAPQLLNHFIYFEHTFLPLSSSSVANHSKIKIGFLGTIHKIHGLTEMIKVADHLSSYPNFELYAIGRVLCSQEELETLKDIGIRTIEGFGQALIPSSIIEEKLKEMDIILFTYPTNKYKLTASGALMTALAFNKIVYSLKNDYFNYIYSLIPFGKLFNTIEELLNYLIENQNSFISQNYENKRLMPEMEGRIFKERLIKDKLY